MNRQSSDRLGLDPSRRQFLKHSGTFAAASALSGVTLPFCHAAGDSTIRLALVGCGGRGAGAVANALSTVGGPVKLHAMADLFEHRLKTSLRGLTDTYPDRVDVPPERQFLGFDAYRRAIDCLQPGDVALLTTHAAFRPLHFEYAVNRGVNVFLEKSFAVDAPAVRRFFRASDIAEQKNLKVGAGLMWRHSRARQEAIQRIHAGDIGDLHTLRIYRVHGPVHCPVRPREANEIAFQIQHASSFSWVSAGFFIDWHCHNVDVACWAKDAWPVKAQAMGGRCYHEAGSQFDHYTVEYTFADGTKLFAFARHMAGCWATYSDYAHGSRGSAILMENLAQPRARLFNSQEMSNQHVIWRFEGHDPDPYVVEWQRLLDAIRNDAPHNEARRAGEANVAALMGRMAAHTGLEVTWDAALNSEFQFVDDIDALTFDSPSPIQEGPDGVYPAPLPGVTIEI